MSETTDQKQLLHLVFGGELKSLDSVEFKDLDRLDIVGVYPNYATALAVSAIRITPSPSTVTALAPASLAARIARAMSACVTLAGRRGITPLLTR